VPQQVLLADRRGALVRAVQAARTAMREQHRVVASVLASARAAMPFPPAAGCPRHGAGTCVPVWARRPGLALAFASALSAAPAAAQRPPELKGSQDKLAEQNRVADDYDLTRMDGPAAIKRLVKSGYLVSIPRRGRGYYVDRKLGKGYARRDVLWYARPWVKKFLQQEGSRYADRFDGARFKVSSLVRTEGYQELLMRRNVNAARGEDDDSRSPHLTGAAVDISKKGMSARQLAWMRDRLVALQERGWIIGTEEMATSAFHIFVQPSFGQEPKKADTASVRPRHPNVRETATPAAADSSPARNRSSSSGRKHRAQAP